MRFFLMILLLLSLPATVLCGKALVRIDADIVGKDYIDISVTQPLQLPTMYTNIEGNISSHDETPLVPDGDPGQDGKITVTGGKDMQYSLQMDDSTNLTNSTDTVTLKLQVVGGKTDRTLDSKGQETVAIIGHATFATIEDPEGGLSSGAYTNAANPTVITAIYK